MNQNGYVDLDNPDTPEDESELIQENHYYPFGMDQLGNWVATVGPKNDYLYNGKEYNEEIGWYDYGARWYDPAIGRWNAVDPLAEQYAPYSPYNYVLGNPISLIDPDGMSVDGPIYGKDGTLIGYEVEEGQGPTQIAEDLNTYYGCELTCEVGWTEIVYNNAEQFQNVFDGDGKIDDKYNGDYKSGNIEPGDILEITNGIDQSSKMETWETKIGQLGEELNLKVEELNEVTDWHYEYRKGGTEPNVLKTEGEAIGSGLNAWRTELKMNHLKDDTNRIGKSIRLYKDSIKMKNEK